jgi:hypothetical protein
MTTHSGALNRKRFWLGGGLVLTLAIALIGWFVVMQPELAETSATRDQIESVELQNTVLAAKNARLKAENEDVEALRAGLAGALAELPADGGLPAFTRQLSSQAAAHAVTLSSVTVGTATPVADPAAAGTAPVVDGAVTDAAAGAAAASDLIQITVTVAAAGLGKDLTAFLYDIQVSGPRRALVTSTQLAPADGSTGTGPDAQSTLNLTLNVFSAPVTADEQAALQKLLSGS